VLLGRGKNPIHIGVWVDANGGSVLHSMQATGVVCQRPIDLQRDGWTLIKYYRCQP
jgi:hypothetical protein